MDIEETEREAFQIGSTVWERICLKRGERRNQSIWCQGLAGMQREMTLEIQVVVKLSRNSVPHQCGFSLFFPPPSFYYETYREPLKILKKRNLPSLCFYAEDRLMHILKAVGVLRCAQFLA